MSKNAPYEPVLAIDVSYRDCDVHGVHLTDVQVRSLDVEYSAPGCDEVIANATSFGWNRSYAAGWERIFGGGDRQPN